MGSYRSLKAQHEAIECLDGEQGLSDVQLLAMAQKLAVDFYAMHGHQVSNPSHDFAHSTHPQERLMWALALHAVGVMRNCDMPSVFEEYKDE